MSRRRRRSLLVPQARNSMDQLKSEVMYKMGYTNRPDAKNDVKYDVAQKLNVPLGPGYNGNLTTEHAGKVGGHIGGPMVREMIRRAQHSMKNNPGNY